MDEEFRDEMRRCTESVCAEILTMDFMGCESPP